MSSKDKKLKSANKRNSSSSPEFSKQTDLGIASEVNNPKTENFITESRPSKKSKLSDLHYKCLRKYLKEDILIGYTEAMDKLQQETDIKCSYSTIRKAIIKLREEINTKSTNLDPSAVKDRSFNDCTMLKDLHIEYLKKYLRENIHIGNTEAMNRLYQDTGLKISVTPLRLTMMKLEEEVRSESELSSSESELKDDVKPQAQSGKLQKLHIECLKKYLSEDISIGCYKAKTKLKQDTGLEASAYTIRKSLTLLKEEIDQDNIERPDSDFETKLRCGTIEQGFKIKEPHIECLKRYLIENSSIRASEAKNRLFADTGLEVTAQVIRNTLKELKEQCDYSKTSKQSSTPNSKTRSKSLSYGRKLKDHHIECLKKYLKEDISIGGTKAMNRLQEETGLEVSAITVQRTLIKLRKEIEQERNDSFSDYEYKIEKRVRSPMHTLKLIHIECLKKYLKENTYIEPSEVKNRLQEETGLKFSTKSIQKALINLRKEMDSERVNLDTSIVENKCLNDRFKLKDSHLESFKNYLKEDMFIGPTETRSKFKEETGLDISVSTVSTALAKLRKEMGLDYDNLAPSVVKKSANTQTKLKGLYLSCLRKYLHGDNFTGPTEANYKNKEQVSLVISLSTFSNTMRNLRKEMDLEHANLKSAEVKGVSNTRSKLNLSHLEFLKSILKEDSLIGPTEAKNRLKEEFGLEMSYSTVRDAMIKIKKELISD